ncbi:protein of unknown function [Azospirillum baldaniorum]|uniref:FAD/NAD(P)-binding domain-containing protein n=1 Tax=Azospirillum baldaniorum TaxID=1064539 RepID=A0A9P1JNK4_9PROT|nr:protein of unknown function [Azospirillum baldaniorum]
MEIDETGAARAIHLAINPVGPDGVVAPAAMDARLPARTILVAAGTQPNTVLAREEPEWVELDGRCFRAIDEDGNPVTPERTSKPAQAHVLMARAPDGRFLSFFGDLHPSFAGNVVKAMGGAKRGYPVVSRALVPPGAHRDHAGGAGAAPERRPAAPGAQRHPPDPDHCGGGGEGPGRGAPFRTRTVLPAAEFRNAGATDRPDHAGHGRAGPDRRLGGQGCRAALPDRPGDGRLVRPLRPAEAGRPGGGDGADRRPHRAPGGRDGGAGRRRAGQRRALLHRAGLPGARQPDCLFRRLQADGGPLQDRTDRGRRRPRRLVLRRGAGFHADAPR